MTSQNFLYDCFVELPKLYDKLTTQNQLVMQEKMSEFAYRHGLSEYMTYNVAKGDFSSYGQLIKEMQQRCLLKSDEVVLPEGMKEIPEEAFLGNDSIRKIIIPASVEKIGKGAFSYCEKLEQIEFHEGSSLFQIESEAFAGSKKLLEINAPDSAHIRFNAFLETEYLHQLITGQQFCPDNVFEPMYLEDKVRVCTMSQNLSETAKEFLMLSPVNAVGFSLVDDEFKDYAAERVKNVIDLAGTKENIAEIMKTVVEETEENYDYAVRAEIMDYQKEKGLFPDKNELIL